MQLTIPLVLLLLRAGNPPYSVLLIPSGPTPFSNGIEVRTIQNISFPGTSNTLNFKLNYPANSSFVATVSDSSGFGSGGTSTPVTVLQSDDSSCYDTSKSVQGPWVFSVNPAGGITQCESVRLWWEQPFVNGTVNFWGVIPGGNSFTIPPGPLSTNLDTGTGFNWTVDINGGTNMFVVAGDDRGIGAGGSAPFTVAYSADASCLNGSSPSSTPGNPAGGSYPTSTSGASTGGGSGGHSSSNTGAIVGGVVGGIGGLLAITFFALFFFRRRRYHAVSKERPVNILQDDEDGPESRQQELPQYYAPEPFLVPDPTLGGTSDAGSTHHGDEHSGRPLSTSTTDILRPQTPASMMTTTTGTRKTGAPPTMRPVNFIQHDDAGPSEAEPETIELPPAYTHIRSVQGSPTASPAIGSAPAPAAAAETQA
ncbi:hypothetical protein BC834DRAFT_895258 [Gloeopeniophorella convolvens]|nr:hypothetical protein BC834DRAFT_895258 [Gloeopeniophorella convolvens]